MICCLLATAALPEQMHCSCSCMIIILMHTIYRAPPAGEPPLPRLMNDGVVVQWSAKLRPSPHLVLRSHQIAAIGNIHPSVDRGPQCTTFCLRWRLRVWALVVSSTVGAACLRPCCVRHGPCRWCTEAVMLLLRAHVGPNAQPPRRLQAPFVHTGVADEAAATGAATPAGASAAAAS